MNEQNPYYGFQRETTEGTPVKPGMIFPQITLPEEEEHEHMFCFAMSNDAALRGCEFCGKSWILPRISGHIWGSWQEVREGE